MCIPYTELVFFFEYFPYPGKVSGHQNSLLFILQLVQIFLTNMLHKKAYYLGPLVSPYTNAANHQTISHWWLLTGYSD